MYLHHNIFTHNIPVAIILKVAQLLLSLHACVTHYPSALLWYPPGHGYRE